MSDPSSLKISIARTSLSLPNLILAGDDDATRSLSVSDYREPAMQARLTYAPSGDMHGDVPLSWSYQETLLAFNVFDEEDGATEGSMRDKIAELVTAIGRLHYTVAVTVNAAATETWTCRAGSVTPVDDRTVTDLQSHRPVWAVSLPAYPIRS